MKEQKWSWWHRFVSGGIGDMTAACFSHPLDLLKVRSQLHGEGLRLKTNRGILKNTIQLIFRHEGMKGFYRGLTASLARQGTFSTMRHGLFGIWVHHIQSENVLVRAIGGSLCGGISALLFNPTDVILIRMQGDGHWPPEHRRNYRHIFHGLKQVIVHESFKNLWVGCGPTVIRAMCVTTSQCVTYFKVKPFLLQRGFQDNIQTHFMAALSSAMVAVIMTNPVDVVKTRLINMSQTNGPVSYNNAIHCLVEGVKKEGPLCLWKGLLATSLRLGPHTIILWLMQENVMSLIQRREH